MESSGSQPSSTRPTSITRAVMETFRWMDEEQDLDLRLALDDYHANVDGVVIPMPNASHPHRPSFRRHMSITQVPFGRSSLSSISNPNRTERSQDHLRTKSRATSMMGPKHSMKNSTSSIDAHATHYQDPEARLKLRVYLASPQKFDEAIEFGFPSLDNSPDSADKENKPPRKVSRELHGAKSPILTSDSAQTFLNDDAVSLCSKDDLSMNDPDSPITPAEADRDFKHDTRRPSGGAKRSMSSSNEFSHLGLRKPTLYRPMDPVTQQVIGGREMTLRMTLTRPDLRANESQLYGWQDREKEKPRGKSPLIEEPMAWDAPLAEKYEKMGPFGGTDGWGPLEKDEGVVKRLWNRVKSQRKTS